MDHRLQNDLITKQNFKQVAYYTIVIRRSVDTLLERRNTIMTFIYTLRSRKTIVNSGKKNQFSTRDTMICFGTRPMLVAWHSGRTSVSGRRTFPVLRSTCS